MKDLKIYCLTLSNSHYEKILEKNYIPVGLGSANYSDKWLTDKNIFNISDKNKFYGEYTFHYNLWKNEIIKNEDQNSWIGFCTYRRFWSKTSKLKTDFSLEEDILQKVPNEWKNYDVVLVDPIYTNKTKISKIIKHGKRIILKNPFLFFNNRKITIKVHFDMYHGYGNLDKAIDLLEIQDKEKFRKYVNEEIMFNPYNMFICKNKKILFQYYSQIFPWLEKCESIFGFDLENSYGKNRIYGFLAERFLSYWFNTYTKPIYWPVYFKDI